jgi:hypothetical protein
MKERLSISAVRSGDVSSREMLGEVRRYSVPMGIQIPSKPAVKSSDQPSKREKVMVGVGTIVPQSEQENHLRKL